MNWQKQLSKNKKSFVNLGDYLFFEPQSAHKARPADARLNDTVGQAGRTGNTKQKMKKIRMKY
jgi:hypothetical protein